MNNEISTGKKTNGEFTISYQKLGYGGAIPVIDGKPEPRLMFGYVSESDFVSCMDLIETALVATNGDVGMAQVYMMNAIQVAANKIHPDEAVEINGVELLIDYGAKKIYYGSAEIANLDDISCVLPDEAIKAMLIDRARLSMEVDEEDDGYDEDIEEDDYEY